MIEHRIKHITRRGFSKNSILI